MSEQSEIEKMAAQIAREMYGRVITDPPRDVSTTPIYSACTEMASALLKAAEEWALEPARDIDELHVRNGDTLGWNLINHLRSLFDKPAAQDKHD